MSHIRPVPQVPSFAVTFYPPGHQCPDLHAADILLVHHYHSDAAWTIRFGEWLRKETRDYNWTNHGCTGLDANHVVQEVAAGAVVSDLSSFDETLYAVVRIKASAEQIASALAFSNWIVKYNQGYGFASIVGDGLDDATGLHLSIGTYGRMVCSAATARTAERLGLIPDRDPAACQPANLAKYFGLTNALAGIALKMPHPTTPTEILAQLAA